MTIAAKILITGILMLIAALMLSNTYDRGDQGPLAIATGLFGLTGLAMMFGGAICAVWGF